MLTHDTSKWAPLQTQLGQATQTSCTAYSMRMHSRTLKQPLPPRDSLGQGSSSGPTSRAHSLVAHSRHLSFWVPCHRPLREPEVSYKVAVIVNHRMSFSDDSYCPAQPRPKMRGTHSTQDERHTR